MIFINIPTWITISRILGIPIIVLFFYLPICHNALISSIVFFVFALTDCIDGYLARRWKQITKFGSFLDPLADKLLIIITLILIEEYFHIWWVTLPVISIIVREVIMLAFREWLICVCQNNIIYVTWLAKIKTVAQMTSLTILLYHFNSFITLLGMMLLYMALILTYWSMYKYLLYAYNILK